MFFEVCFSPTLFLLTWLRHCPENVLCRGCPQHRHHCSCDLHGGGKVGTISRWIYAIGFPALLPRPVCWGNKTSAQERFAVCIRQALPKCLLKWMTQPAVLQVAESESVGENLDYLERIKIGDFISPSPKCIVRLKPSPEPPVWLGFNLPFGTGWVWPWQRVTWVSGGTGTIAATTQCLHTQSELHVSGPDVHSLHLQSCTLHIRMMLLLF